MTWRPAAAFARDLDAEVWRTVNHLERLVGARRARATTTAVGGRLYLVDPLAEIDLHEEQRSPGHMKRVLRGDLRGRRR